MGAITRALGNSLTTGGVVKSTAINNTSVSGITVLPGAITGLGSLVLIKEITASASASIEFINGTNGVVLDSTYDSYVFKFYNIHPQTTEDFMWQCNATGQTGYNETITSTTFETYNAESGGTPGVGYDGGRDLAQGTSFQPLANNIQNDNDSGGCGFLILYNPSSTTYVKHFIGTMTYMNSTQTQTIYSAGYVNTTSAIDEIQFKFETGNIDDGIIKLYGVKKS